ncbi:MAG3450 family membrane protein [Mycoplasma simbae]|uniref:MAG3450 family membrane protein n=1 Tax=Mycoplasma simbae TaxID=36744 RepID=UPI00049847AF|nr:hypothetical protein [Mycoplasma simbae]
MSKNKYAPLIAVFFIALTQILPLTTLWLVGTKDFLNQILFDFNIILWVPIAISIISIVVAIVLIYFKQLNLKSINFIVPLSCLYTLVITTSLSSLSMIVRFAIALGCTIVITILTNVVASLIEEKFYFNKV